MTEQERKWFDSLIEDRKESAKTLEKPSMRGVRKSVVEKYSEQAHFIYELLQNANDVEATKVTFNLENEGLYFSHNGTINFSISNPNTEDEDKETDLLGHINSITSIANTNKTESSVGKFGVGFKSVFQYTETPHIYDKNFRFKIERFIVPQLLEKDSEKRQENETTFYFPFDNQQKPATEAYKDILKKLNNLTYPTLFLSNLREVSWKSKTEKGKYYKKPIQEQQEGNMSCEKFELFQEINNEKKKERIWLFSRQIENQNHFYSVGFFLDEKEKLKQTKLDAFCFFPTKENTNLNFIIHAPFLLTDSREGIKKGQTNNWNEILIEKLAELAADSLLILKDLRLLNDDIINIIPYKKSNFEYSSLFIPFYYKIKEKLKKEELLPSSNGEFTNINNAYWAEYSPMTELYSNDQLAFLSNNADSKWAFTSIGRNYAMYKIDRELGEYLDEIIPKHLDNEHLLDKITKDFIKECSFEWLYKFYGYLLTAKTYMDKVKTKPIFKDVNGNAVSAFEYGNKQLHNILFLPTDYENSDFITIHPKLLKDEKSKEFILAFGITEPDLKSEIYKISKDSPEIINKNFEKLFKYYKEFRDEEFINIIKDKEFVRVKTNNEYSLVKANEIYYPSDDLKQYFEDKPDTKFLDLEFYHNLIKENEWELLVEFLQKLGIATLPRILSNNITDLNKRNEYRLAYSTRGHLVIEKYIDGCEQILQNLNQKKSNLLWRFLTLLSDKYNLCYELKVEHKYYYYSPQREYFESSESKRLKITRWLLTKGCEFVSPQELYINDLSSDYDIEREGTKKLIDFLGIKEMVSEVLENKNLTDDEMRFIEKGKMVDELTNDEIKELLRKRNESIFPTSNSVYPNGRAIKIAEVYKNSSPKISEPKERSVRISPPDNSKEYLKSLYENEDKKLICQICENEMPFKKKDEEYYFEAIEIFSKTNILRNESEIPYICCCPICSAKYQSSGFIDEAQKNKIKEEILNENITPNKDGNYEIPISSISLDEAATICFANKHFMDLKTILEVENGSQLT